MRLRKGWMVTDFALLTYVLPTAFLVIPFVHIMHQYGMVGQPLVGHRGDGRPLPRLTRS